MSKPIVDQTKGTSIMDRIMLSQYRNSPIMRQYMLAFIEEMDLLFAEIEEVYLGRFIEWAVGTQLDIIGKILDESRNVVITGTFFGFNDGDTVINTPGVEALADEATPTIGGTFLDETQNNFTIVPLGDNEYRKLLLAKAYLSTQDNCSIDTFYHAISTLLGRTPALMKLVLSPGSAMLELSAADTTFSNSQLIQYFGRYVIPLGTTFTISRILK